MILGSVSFTNSYTTDYFVNKIRSAIDLEDHFYTVEQEGLNGGYYLHPKLPCKPADIYYYDIKCNITVLLSGYIYNQSGLSQFYDIDPQISGPEFIARMFLKEGPLFVDKLNGDFSILVYRPEKGECYLFRDHVGIHPLCWTINKNSLYFSTEILGLCRAFSDGKNIDLDYILGYLKYTDLKKTPCEEVHRLLAGHYLKYTDKGVELIKYWHPKRIRIDKNLEYDQMLSDLRSILYDSVKVRCDRRFVAGAHVSGGIDSGIISKLARNNFKHQEKFYGFSWSPVKYTYGNIEYDERELVMEICKESNIDPVFSSLSSDEIPRFISSFYWNHGFFSEDITSEQVLKTNSNLLFSGWGGDEFISTGDRGIELDLLRGLKFKLYFKRNPVKHPLKLLRYLLSYVIFPATGILGRETSESFKDDSRYLKKHYKQSDRKAIANFYFHTSRNKMHLNMLKFYHLQDRCEHWTIMGFRKGIEYRYPLLDKRIIEYMLKVPSELLCRTDYFRPILRVIGKDIMPEKLRLNWDKSDPVYWSWMDEIIKESAIMAMKEVNIWETNPDLYFVDFDLLESDIERFRNKGLMINPKILYKSLVYIKAINDFTIQYSSTKS